MYKETTVNKVSSTGRAAYFLGEEKELLQILRDLFTPTEMSISYPCSFVPGVWDFYSPLFILVAYYSDGAQILLGMLSLNNAVSLPLCLKHHLFHIAGNNEPRFEFSREITQYLAKSM